MRELHRNAELGCDAAMCIRHHPQYFRCNRTYNLWKNPQHNKQEQKSSSPNLEQCKSLKLNEAVRLI
jgi:hypothetical protein